MSFYETIYFVHKPERFGGGATMGCYQPYLACKDLNINSAILTNEELMNSTSKVKNSIIFLFKNLIDQSLIDRLKDSGNILLSYPGDVLFENLDPYIKTINNIDSYIVGTFELSDYISSLGQSSCVIPANHDHYLNSTRHKHQRESSFSLYFGGSRDPQAPTQGELGLDDNNISYTNGYFDTMGEFRNKAKDFDSFDRQKYSLEYVPEILDSHNNPSLYSCHYAVRAPWVGNYLRQWYTKTGGKVSTAAAAGANIITSLDPAVRVLIDEDYPYSIDTETEEFKNNYKQICYEFYIKTKESFGTKRWFDGLNILKEVKERTLAENIVLEYINYAEELYQS